MQDIAWYLSLVLVAGILLVFLTVFLRSQNSEDYVTVQSKAGSNRRKFFWTLVVFGVFITAITTANLPYSETHGGGENRTALSVDVEGSQWSWRLSRSEVPEDTPVVFNVTSSDVNHGLGIYDENLRLIGQTQAMPGYTNKLVVTFDSPGTYKLMCLEYCGLAHHLMIADFVVTPLLQERLSWLR